MHRNIAVEAWHSGNRKDALATLTRGITCKPMAEWDDTHRRLLSALLSDGIIPFGLARMARKAMTR